MNDLTYEMTRDYLDDLSENLAMVSDVRLAQTDGGNGPAG